MLRKSSDSDDSSSGSVSSLSDSDDDSATEPVAAAPAPIRPHESDPIIYIAPKPAKPWASIILKRVLFPPVLILDAVQQGVNYLFGEKISKEILPAQSDNLEDFYNKSDDRYIEKQNLPRKKSPYSLMTVQNWHRCKFQILMAWKRKTRIILLIFSAMASLTRISPMKWKKTQRI